MPTASIAKIRANINYLNAAMLKYEIDTPLRIAAFLAQVAHESGCLRYVRELASGKAYEGRADLGNIHPGDGRRYKGRTWLQCTGRFNYARVSSALGIDFINNPELMELPEHASEVSGWIWKISGFNNLADERDFKKITRILNGGYTHLDRREAFYSRALEVLGCSNG